MPVVPRRNAVRQLIIKGAVGKKDCSSSVFIPTPSAVPSARFRYAIQKAEAYQMSLASELQQHFIPLIGSI